MRQRVDAILSLDLPTEQLPALSTLLAATKAEFEQLERKVQSGEFKRRNSSVRFPERAISVQHPGLWRQL
jgi:hypothetical protein